MLVGALLAALLVVASGCAERSIERTSSKNTPPPSFLANEPERIGVVALAPDQTTRQHWYEFDPGAKAWLERGPEITRRARHPNRATLGQSTKGYALALAEAGDGRVFILGALFAPVMLPLRYAVERAKPGPEYDRILPLKDVLAPDELPQDAFDKGRIVQEIRDRIVGLSRPGARPQFVATEWKEDTESSQVDAVLTLRVVSVGLIADRVGDPNLALKVYVWTHYDRLDFAPFEYRSRKRPLAAWAAADGLLIGGAVSEAITALAEQVSVYYGLGQT